MEKAGNKKQQINQGYGTVYREVMRNPALTVESKAIYSLLCSYAGNNSKAFPTVETMCSDLNISKTRFYRHLDLLISAGIIQKKPRLQNHLKIGTNYEILDSRISTKCRNSQNSHAPNGNESTNCGFPQNKDKEYKQGENKHIKNNSPDTGGSSFEYDKQSPSTVKLW